MHLCYVCSGSLMLAAMFNKRSYIMWENNKWLNQNGQLCWLDMAGGWLVNLAGTQENPHFPVCWLSSLLLPV